MIRRFIDPDAEFDFIAKGGEIPAGTTPFDMPGVEYGHHGNDCTFETVMKKHRLEGDPGLVAVAGIVHDLDMHEMKLAETSGLDAMLTGLKAWEKDDHALLEKSFILFEALYRRALAQVAARA